MTTTYDTELNSDTVAAPAVSEPTESLYACYDDPDNYTISAAWASSPLGEPDDKINDSFEAIEAVDEPKSPTSRAALAAALAAGIIGGATLGAVLFGYADPGQPSIVVPWAAVKTSPSQEIATPSSPPAPPKPPGQRIPRRNLPSRRQRRNPSGPSRRQIRKSYRHRSIRARRPSAHHR